MKHKTLKFFLILLFIFTFFYSDQVSANEKKEENSAMSYKLLESVPLVGSAGDVVTFPTYVSKIYILAISSVGIAALLMLTVGGFYYLVSAGNQSLATTAKKIIFDALFGLIVALLGWVILNTINPELLNGKINMGEMKLPPPTSNAKAPVVSGNVDTPSELNSPQPELAP